MPNFVNLPRSIAPTMSADIIIISVIGANGQPLPIYGNSIGSNWSAPVKQERADEAEIQELAAKMVETQKAALAKQQQQAAQTASRQATVAPNGMQLQPPHNNGQTNILNYLSRQQKLPNGSAPAMHNAAATASTTNGSRSVLNNSTTGGSSGAAGDSSSISSSDKKAPCDEESQMGHFGWHTFGKTYIPYIFRQGQEKEKYCSVRMIELKLLGKYLNCLHPDIYSSCTCVRSYYITEAEARLLIEINHKHCDGEFGRDMFTQKDLVVRLSDATKFYQFLDICYRKLISGSKSPSEKCGFIRINKESVVPYTVRNNEQVVPLFYFEGETENLKQKADYLSGWDLAYLKFCCKVQGIRNELFSSENVAVISLTDIKSYFPNGTEFEDYWPSKVVDSNLLIGNRSNSNNAINWTRQPTQPPPKVMTQTNLAQKASSHSAAAAAAAAAQQQQMLKRGAAGGPNASYAAQSAAAAAAAVAAMQQQPGQRMHPNSASLAQATAQALTNSWMTQPLMHAQIIQAQQQSQHPSSRGQYRNNPMVNLILGQPDRQNYNYNNAGISMQPVNSHAQGNAPPPLVRSAGGQNANHMSLQAGNPYMQQHQVHPAVVQQQQRLAAAAQHHSQQNGRSSSNSAVPNSASMHLQRHALANAAAAEGVNRLSVIPELTPNNMNAQPYKVQKVYVDNHLVPCINMKAYNDSEQLMTLTDFQRFFFPKVPLENCKILIETLGVELYKGNRRQVQILMENDRNHNENIPLVQVRDIMKYMTQLTFMIRNQDQPPAKRTRMS